MNELDTWRKARVPLAKQRHLRGDKDLLLLLKRAEYFCFGDFHKRIMFGILNKIKYIQILVEKGCMLLFWWHSFWNIVWYIEQKRYITNLGRKEFKFLYVCNDSCAAEDMILCILDWRKGRKVKITRIKTCTYYCILYIFIFCR